MSKYTLNILTKYMHLCNTIISQTEQKNGTGKQKDNDIGKH